MDTGQYQPDDHPDDDGEYHAPDPVIHLRRAVRSFGSLIDAFNAFQNGVDPGHHSAGYIACAKPRHDFVTDNLRGAGVGQRAFEAIPDLDTDLSILDRDEQERAVVGAFLAQLPMSWLRGEKSRRVNRLREKARSEPPPDSSSSPRALSVSCRAGSRCPRAGHGTDRRRGRSAGEHPALERLSKPEGRPARLRRVPHTFAGFFATSGGSSS